MGTAYILTIRFKQNLTQTSRVGAFSATMIRSISRIVFSILSFIGNDITKFRRILATELLDSFSSMHVTSLIVSRVFLSTYRSYCCLLR